MYRKDLEARLRVVAKALKNWWNADRQIIFRSHGRIRFLHLSDVLQFAGLAVGGWIIYSTISYFVLQRTITDKDVKIAVSNQAYHKMLEEILSARRRFDAISSALEKNDLHVLPLNDSNRELKGDLEKLQKSLQGKQRENRRTSGLGRHGEREISMIETEMHAAERPALVDGAEIDEEANLSYSPYALWGNREQIDTERFDREMAKLRKAEKRLIERINGRAKGDIRRIRKVVAWTGLNVEQMLRRSRNRTHGQGGPFIPLLPFLSGTSTTAFARSVSALGNQLTRLDRHHQVIRAVPIGAPLKRYHFASGYGKRLDPINNSWALHGGTDLSYRLGTKVHSMAPGRVRISRWVGQFGRMIEIDHGMGIRTRYAHLQKILVKRRERVEYGQPIGLLGSSGRSTGPHLHYEIHVNFRRVNPIRFIKAEKDVFKD